DSLVTTNDILMNATNYPLWLLSGLILLRGASASRALSESGNSLIQAIREKGPDRITTAKQFAISLSSTTGSALMLCCVLFSHPVIAYQGPVLKASAMTFLFLSAGLDFGAAIKRQTWKDGFIAGLKRLKKNGFSRHQSPSITETK
ncbi:MAG TPA: hypothetical protein VJC18_04470, partial [bacterium]|nr:hypothetical protein [bacterium]